ncbi:Uncharacterized protein Rs2_30558 [Raphanus sativus]|nr:Uncharacterized protein Rs2_30558 [Raphanus sativus]
MVTLRLEGGVHVCVSLFYGHTVTFQARFDQHTTEPKVMIFTSVNPKVVGGKLFLNATSDWLGMEQMRTKSKVILAQKIEPLTVAELNQYVLAADPHTIKFLCKAEVTSLQSEKGWGYIGYSKQNAMGVLRVDESSIVNDQPSAPTAPSDGLQAANKQKLVDNGNMRKKARKE